MSFEQRDRRRTLSLSAHFSRYEDAACTKLAAGEPEPLSGAGVICESIASGWCESAYTILTSPAGANDVCPEFGKWTCMTSCEPGNKGNSILVRSVGKQVDGGTVMW